jgi:hypothetical protein
MYDHSKTVVDQGQISSTVPATERKMEESEGSGDVLFSSTG